MHTNNMYVQKSTYEAIFEKLRVIMHNMYCLCQLVIHTLGPNTIMIHILL